MHWTCLTWGARWQIAAYGKHVFIEGALPGRLLTVTSMYVIVTMTVLTRAIARSAVSLATTCSAIPVQKVGKGAKQHFYLRVLGSVHAILMLAKIVVNTIINCIEYIFNI